MKHSHRNTNEALNQLTEKTMNLFDGYAGLRNFGATRGGAIEKNTSGRK